MNTAVSIKKPVQTAIKGFTLRFAEEGDVPLILYFIKSLAEYENLSPEVVATEEILHENLFQKKYAEVIIGEYQHKPVGFMLFFHNFSTFLGKPGIYLEDLFILPEMRRMGFGKVMFAYLAQLALQRDCGRVEWACLDWNSPSIAFYKSIGGKPMDDWTVYRLSGRALLGLAGKSGC